ncbi:hypothetical protein BGX21_005124 [Mortierella sp. AD011]|nr:hypothetical protein BGX21_005124 [Mortierella sp. AD011]
MLPRRRKTKQQQQQLLLLPPTTTTITTTSKRTPSALCILEILEHILSFLSQHALRNVAPFVCSQWYHASRRHILSEAVWASNFQAEKRLEAISKFKDCQILTLTPDAPQLRSLPYTWPNASHAQRQIAWREVLIHIQKASTNKEKKNDELGLDKVRILDLRGSLDVRVFSRVVEQCLAQQLVVLQLETFKPGDYFYLERILKGCPRLEVLKVEPQSDTIHGQAIPGSSPDDPGSELDSVREAALRERQLIEPLEWTDNLKLKTLILFRPMISQRVIQAILSCCPEMRVLKLFSMIERASLLDPATTITAAAAAATTTTATNDTIPIAVTPIYLTPIISHETPNEYQRMRITSPYDIDAFITHIATSCPRLHTFHLSLHTRKLSAETMNMILERLPRVRHWSFAMRDIAPPTILPILQDRTALNGGRLTSLEIRCAGFMDPDRSTSIISKTLHEFLCTSPTLLHLVAPTVTYYTEYLDLKRILVGSKDSHPDTPRADGRFWACRSLKTLHLEIRARFESDTLQHSRVIFGYLSKVTPKLEDLQLRRPYLSFWLAGGLCLLSRLHNLERLKLCCRSYTGFYESDVLEWIKREGHPWGRVSPNRVAVSSSIADATRLGCRMALIRAGLVAPPTSYHLSGYSSTSSSPDSGITYPELKLEDFASLGEIKDIEDLQIERMLLYQHQKPCWPRLESFTIAHDGWFNNSETSGIERLRPDVQFRFETQSFHQNGYH